MQVGEENLARPHPVELRIERFLDLQNQVGLFPDIVGAAGQSGAGLPVGAVRDGAADAGPRFNQHLVPAGDEGGDPGRSDGDAVLVVLDLGGDSDPHVSASLQRPVAI